MAKTQAKKQNNTVDCKDCKHAYDWHEKGADGLPFLCRCRLHTKRSRFLTRDGCEQFDKIM
ncbi:MAG: hypothetical protein IKU16_09525 [Muribaculaceae bacterium]|nr:hypothetical protein [Muribaculaceae bacterium]MBR4887491.1 hypothetical protein [Muribaculaceae bacterium]